MASERWPLFCVSCGERIGLSGPVRVIDGEGHVVAANAEEVHADPYRYRSRVLHDACALASGVQAIDVPRREPPDESGSG